MKDRDEQHYDHEESEYHFSDDDVSYEVETEASKPAAPEPEKKNPLAGLTQSKRMIISLVVFLGLVFVVYKMVSPGTTVPSTDINPVVTTQPVSEIAPPAIPHTVQTPEPVATAPAQPAASAQAPAMSAQAPAAPTPAAAPAPATTTTTTTVVSTPAPAPAQPVAAAPAAPQPVAQAAQSVQPSAMPPAPLTTPATAAPVAQSAQQSMPVATTVVTTPAVTPSNTDATIAAMAATNEKLMNQLQAEYSQKVTDFSNQNKALQDQMQTLSSRVAGLESQLNQLVQTLTRQTGMGGPTSLNVVPVQQPAPLVESPRIRYSVQAIIPGRAWLKSDNGETLTVAEGDSIRELGRVTKIDPYDGVVEVNTGSRTVSISYGNGG